VLHVGLEGRRIGAALDCHGGAYRPSEGDRGDQRLVLAAVARDLAVGQGSPLGALA
jgi:hypothetical protein